MKRNKRGRGIKKKKKKKTASPPEKILKNDEKIRIFRWFHVQTVTKVEAQLLLLLLQLLFPPLLEEREKKPMFD